VTLGVKLCGFQGYGLILFLVAAGAVAELWHDRKVLQVTASAGFWKAFLNPVVIAGLLVFLVLFRLAGLRGLVEYDAVMAGSLKAKILHLYTGGEIVRWFSNPRLAHACFDYPALMPSLHA